MAVKQPKGRFKRVSWWISSLSIFFVFLVILFVADGANLAPNLNDSENIAGRAADWLMESKLFNEWFTPFSFPLFNLVTILYIVFLLANAIATIYSLKRQKKRKD